MSALAKLEAARELAAEYRRAALRTEEIFGREISHADLPPVTDVVPHGEVGRCAVAPAVARRAWLFAVEQEERARVEHRQKLIDAHRILRRRSYERAEDPGRKSQYRGVSWDGLQACWAADISIDGHKVHLGCFGDEDLAARIYDAAARDYGVPGRQNLPGRPLP